MQKLRATGWCGKQHTLDEILTCRECSRLSKLSSEKEFKDMQKKEKTMTDDNLDDVQKPQVYRLNLPDDVEQASSVGINEIIDNAYKEIWNAAIEAAACVIDQCNRAGPYHAIGGAKKIRELKK